MNLRKLFLSLDEVQRDRICDIIIEAGIGVSAGTLTFRDFVVPYMQASHGNARAFLKYFSRLDPAQQHRFYEAMLSDMALPN